MQPSQYDKMDLIKAFLVKKRKLEWAVFLSGIETYTEKLEATKKETTLPPDEISDFILQRMEKKFGVTLEMLRDKSRDRTMVDYRKIYWYCMKQHSSATYIELAHSMGRNDHSTVLHGIKSAKELFKFDAAFRDKLSFMLTDIDINFQKSTKQPEYVERTESVLMGIGE